MRLSFGSDSGSKLKCRYVTSVPAHVRSRSIVLDYLGSCLRISLWRWSTRFKLLQVDNTAIYCNQKQTPKHFHDLVYTTSQALQIQIWNAILHIFSNIYTFTLYTCLWLFGFEQDAQGIMLLRFRNVTRVRTPLHGHPKLQKRFCSGQPKAKQNPNIGVSRTWFCGVSSRFCCHWLGTYSDFGLAHKWRAILGNQIQDTYQLSCAS